MLLYNHQNPVVATHHRWIQLNLRDSGGDAEAQEVELRDALVEFGREFAGTGCQVGDEDGVVLRKVRRYFEGPDALEWLVIIDDAVAVSTITLDRYLPAASSPRRGCIIQTRFHCSVDSPELVPFEITSFGLAGELLL